MKGFTDRELDLYVAWILERLELFYIAKGYRDIRWDSVKQKILLTDTELLKTLDPELVTDQVIDYLSVNKLVPTSVLPKLRELLNGGK